MPKQEKDEMPPFSVHEMIDNMNLHDMIKWVVNDEMVFFEIYDLPRLFVHRKHSHRIDGLLARAKLPIMMISSSVSKYPPAKYYWPLLEWCARGDMVALVEESEGGIIGYVVNTWGARLVAILCEATEAP